MNFCLARSCELMSRTFCIAAPPVVVFTYWNPIYSNPLVLKELLTLGLGMLAFLTWWISLGGPVRGRRVSNPYARPLAYLCLWALLTIAWPWNEPKAMGFHHWSCYAGLMLFIPPLFTYGAQARFRSLYLLVLLLTVTFMLVLGASQINGYSLGGLLSVGGGDSRRRMSLTIGHNNGVSPILLFASFLSLGMAVVVRSVLLRIPLILLTVGCWLFIVFFLLTRSTILGLAAGLFLLIVFNLVPLLRRKTTEHPFLKRLLLGGAAALVVFALFAGSIALRGGNIQGEYDPNLARNITDRLRTFNPSFLMVDSRARLWSIGALMAADHPLFGMGFSASKFAYSLYQAKFFERYPDFPAGPTPKQSERLHNDYLQWAVECGAIGTVLLLWCLFVFLRSGWRLLHINNGLGAGARFQQSCFFIALLVLLLDGVFSFPGHIAPIAVFFPGLLMLWAAMVEPTRREAGRVATISAGRRFIIGLMVWLVVAQPIGFASASPTGWVGKTGVYVPFLAQFVGRTHEGVLDGIGPDVRNELDRMKRQLESGTVKSLEDIHVLLDLIEVIRAKYRKVEEIVPFAGQALLYAGDFEMRLHVFFGDQRQRFFDTVTRLARSSEPKAVAEIKDRLVETYRHADEHLPEAERFYQKALTSYRWHGLYWSLGLVQLELASRATLPKKTSESLIQSAREAMKTARRIFSSEERLFLELDVALRVEDLPAAVDLSQNLMNRAPHVLIEQVFPKIVERSVRRDSITGKMRLDPVMEEFFRILLPHLGVERTGVLLYALTILDYGNAKELAGEYAKVAKERLSPLESVFLDFRVLRDRGELAGLSEELEFYRQFIAANPEADWDKRALYLSDLQRFAPKSADLSEWAAEMEGLVGSPDRPFPMAVGLHSLAQQSYERGDWVECWRRMMRADAVMSWQMQSGLDGRRNGVLDSALWGVTHPLMMN